MEKGPWQRYTLRTFPTQMNFTPSRTLPLRSGRLCTVPDLLDPLTRPRSLYHLASLNSGKTSPIRPQNRKPRGAGISTGFRWRAVREEGKRAAFQASRDVAVLLSFTVLPDSQLEVWISFRGEVIQKKPIT